MTLATTPDTTSAPDVDDVLLTSITRLEHMAEDADAAAREADQRARDWNNVAEAHDRLARGYRKALDYLAQRAEQDRQALNVGPDAG